MAFVDTDNLKNVSWWFAKQRNLKILFKIDFRNTSDGNVFDNMTIFDLENSTSTNKNVKTFSQQLHIV